MGQMPKIMRMFGPDIPSKADGLEPGDAWVNASGELRICLTAGPPATWERVDARYQEHHFCKSVLVDLSGAAVAGDIMLHPTLACTLRKLTAVYPEATSADAGVVFELGTQADANYYFTGTSHASQAAWFEEELTLLKTDLPAGETLVFGDAGGKVGTGTLFVVVEYTIDD